MRISDWSSDVCSSDLAARQADGDAIAIPLPPPYPGGEAQEIGLGQRVALDIAEQPIERRVALQIAAAIDEPIAGAVLERDAPLPACVMRHHPRIGGRRSNVDRKSTRLNSSH